jgi:hypothetical protein
VKQNWAAAALVVALSTIATAQVAILQIRIVEGDGGVHQPGARLSRPLTVEVTDETGRPVSGAAVSFHLPDDGPSGAFTNGLRTEILTTDERGRAVLRSMVLNRNPGRFQIRVIASKEQARAGMVSFQYIAGASTPAATASAAGSQVRRGHGKWWAIAAIVAGGAAAGVLTTSRSHGSSASSSTASPVSIGSPSVTVGKP